MRESHVSLLTGISAIVTKGFLRHFVDAGIDRLPSDGLIRIVVIL